jgi:ZIP family zinc transporter
VLKKEISAKANALLTGTAAGIMLAASVWSLLLPAIDQATGQMGGISALFIAISVIIGGLLLTFLHSLEVIDFEKNTVLGVFSGRNGQSYMRMFIAVTLHNIPEGLAVGFAFGVAWAVKTQGAFAVAAGLALGIGIQNLPEGAAVALPMRTEFKSKRKAFYYGTASGACEAVCPQNIKISQAMADFSKRLKR